MKDIFAQELNGKQVTTADLQALMALQFGHFTAMQVRHKQVKGLERHLHRLEQSSKKLFGCHMPANRIMTCLRNILTDDEPCSIRINIFTRNFYKPVIQEDDLQVLITRSAPAAAATAPIRVKTEHFERLLPDVKYAGIVSGILAYQRDAKNAGYDDVLYINAAQQIAEGSIWNIGFYNGKEIILPATAALPGIGIQLMGHALQSVGIAVNTRVVPLAEVPQLQGAFYTNSVTMGGIISGINQHFFATDNQELTALLATAYNAVPWDDI